MTDLTSLAALFDTVKAEKKQNKGKVILRRKVKDISTPSDLDDEWLLGVKETAILVDAIEYTADARIVLFQPWQCACGNCGQNHLGLFLRERSTRTHTVRWRNVGVKFDYAALALPQETQWLDPENVSACSECESFTDGRQLTLGFDNTTPEQLAPLVQEIVESMLVAKPGFDNYGKRILSPHVCLKEQLSDVTGETVGYTEDKVEQERERQRAENRRFG